MSLRRALIALPDDRDTAAATREVVAYFAIHAGEPIEPIRLERAIGILATRVEPVLAALRDAMVIDCDGDPSVGACTYAPDRVLDLEVRRFLRASGVQSSGIQRRVERFRGGFGSGS